MSASVRVTGAIVLVVVLPLAVAPARAQTSQPPQTPLQQALGTDPRRDEDQMRGDQVSVVRIDNRLIDPTRANFIDLPGTDTGFQIGGYAKLDTIYDPRPAGNIDKFVSSTIPVELPGEGQPSNFNLHARQTRFQLNFIKGTQATPRGPLRFYLEADFFGADGPLAFRMRHAYGSKANLLAGHTWTTFADPDAYPDTVDFEMAPGTTQNRQPQIRYTIPLNAERNMSIALAIEKPTVDIEFEGVTRVTRWPDVIARFRRDWKGAHVQLGGVFRSMGASDLETTTDTAFGIAGSATVGWTVVGSDLLTAGIVGGQGAAHYISTISGLGLDAAINEVDRELDPVSAIGAYAAYKHLWSDRWRSTLSYGFNNVEDNQFLPDTAIESNHVASANLILKFARAATVGLEYIWGDNHLMGGDDGWAQRLQLGLKYDFTK